MAQKQKMNVHTELDQAHLVETQKLVDKILVPHCMRKTRALNISWGVGSLLTGILCFHVMDQPLVGVVLLAVAVIFMLRGIFVYHMVAMGSRRRMAKGSAASDYILEKNYLWAISGGADAHYPYEDCTRLLETPGSFYVITKKGEAILLDKSGLTGGTAEELRDWLAEKCQKPVETVGPDWKLAEAPAPVQAVKEENSEKQEENPQ